MLESIVVTAANHETYACTVLRRELLEAYDHIVHVLDKTRSELDKFRAKTLFIPR